VLYARAVPEKVEITENYSIKQDISSNPRLVPGAQAGRIEVSVPYDGEAYFTRQAVDDVKWGNRSGRGQGQGAARIGYLLLGNHAKTGELGQEMRMYESAGVIPIEVPVPVGDSLDQLSDDQWACLTVYEYRPADLELCPLTLDVRLYDPDTLLFEAVDVLANWGEINLGSTIDQLRRDGTDVGFTNGLEMSIRAQLSVPVKKIRGTENYTFPSPVVKRVSVGWPEITSLDSMRLNRDTTDIERQSQRRADPQREPDTRVPHPVRYNPDGRCLEWEKIPMTRANGSPGIGVYQSAEMHLEIRHPGELFTTLEQFERQTLALHAEVEIPEYLLSGLEAELFDATGNRRHPPRRSDSRMPKLTTRVSIDTNFYVADIFAKRYFKPYQQFVFDDVVPSDMRITDIQTVLRHAKFDTELKVDEAYNRENENAPRWLLRATRSQGPDTLALLIAVDGEKHVLDREQLTGNDKIKLVGSKESGQMRLSVLGTLPREHANLTREMNLLQQQLRTRFRFQQTSRG
jgi:hypothetical protein